MLSSLYACFNKVFKFWKCRTLHSPNMQNYYKMIMGSSETNRSHQFRGNCRFKIHRWLHNYPAFFIRGQYYNRLFCAYSIDPRLREGGESVSCMLPHPHCLSCHTQHLWIPNKCPLKLPQIGQHKEWESDRARFKCWQLVNNYSSRPPHHFYKLKTFFSPFRAIVKTEQDSVHKWTQYSVLQTWWATFCLILSH